MNKPVPKNPSKEPKKTTGFTKKKAVAQVFATTTSREEGMRRGQAINLAVAHAISDKNYETKHIVKLFLEYYELADMLQKTSMDDLRGLIDD